MIGMRCATRAAEAIASGEQNVEQHELAAMRARTRELARIRQEPSADAEILELVSFRLGGESYAVEARYVYQIMLSPPITIIPHTPDFLFGVINLRGEILAVFDLNHLFGLSSGPNQGPSRLIVLGKAQPQFGFVAEAVDQVTRIDASQLNSPAAPLGIAGREIVRGVTADALIILDGEILLADERLMIDQREDGAGA